MTDSLPFLDPGLAEARSSPYSMLLLCRRLAPGLVVPDTS